ncbi:MAG: cation transporter [Pirellulaceae bacterium]
MRLDGIHCRACVWLLERLPRLMPGVSEARLNLHRGVLTVTWDAEQTKLSQVAVETRSTWLPPLSLPAQ